MLRFDIEVSGAAAAEKAIDGVDGAARRAAGGLDRMERELGESEAAARRADRQFDRAASAASRLGSAVVGIAVGVGLEKLLEMGEQGGRLQATSQRLDRLGYSAENTSELIRRLGGGSVSSVEQLISAADQAGLSFDQMKLAGDAALKVAIARGEDSHKVFEKVSKTLATGRTAYLKQIGVTVEAQQAQLAYAESVGKTAAELTEAERLAATQTATIEALNAAFGDQAPDQYASNIGAVRDAFDDLADEIKRHLGDALSDLGAVIGMLRGGGEAQFASDYTASRRRFAQETIKDLESVETALVKAKERGEDIGDVVLDLQDKFGEERFVALLGLSEPADRISAGYIDALGKARAALGRLRADEAALQAVDDARAAEAAAAAEAEARAGAAEAAQREAMKASQEAARALVRAQAQWRRELELTEAIDLGAVLAGPAVTADDILGADVRETVDETLTWLESRVGTVLGAVANAGLDLGSGVLAGFEAIRGGLLDADDAASIFWRDVREGAAEWQRWAGVALSAIDSVGTALGGVSALVDALAAADVAPLRNAATAADDALRLAEAEEKRAQSERDRAGSASEAAAADGRLATAAKKRAAAEAAVAAARNDLLAAEERAAEVRQRLHVLEMALEAAKSGAKAIEMVALAAAKAAIPDPAGAIAAGISAAAYLTAAAAYGAGAVITASTPTASASRATAPATDDAEIGRPSADATRSAGQGGGGPQTTIVNANFLGQPLHTRSDIQDALIDTLDEASRRRGAPSANLTRLQSRGRR